MRDAGHWTPDIGQRTAEKAKIIYPPPRGVDMSTSILFIFATYLTVCFLRGQNRRISQTEILLYDNSYVTLPEAISKIPYAYYMGNVFKYR